MSWYEEHKESYHSTEYYCPYCGKQTVVQDDLDDYYHGASSHCTSCNAEMCCL